MLDSFGFVHYCPGVWVEFYADGKHRWAQFDGLLFLDNPGRVVVIEVKYQHTPDAFFQLENCYLPLVRHLFRRSNREICSCEVVKWYDCATRFPRPVVLREHLSDVRAGEFAVHILNRD